MGFNRVLMSVLAILFLLPVSFGSPTSAAYFNNQRQKEVITFLDGIGCDVITGSNQNLCSPSILNVTAIDGNFTITSSAGYILQMQNDTAMNSSAIYQNGTKMGVNMLPVSTATFAVNSSGLSYGLYSYGSMYTTANVVTGGNNGIITYFARGTSSSYPFIIQNTTGTEIVRFANTGNVGIGTTTTTRKLEVNGNIGLYNDLIFTAVDPIIQASNAAGYFRFYTGTTERLRLTNTGDVGLGTTTPYSKLDLNDNVLSRWNSGWTGLTNSIIIPTQNILAFSDIETGYVVNITNSTGGNSMPLYSGTYAGMFDTNAGSYASFLNTSLPLTICINVTAGDNTWYNLNHLFGVGFYSSFYPRTINISVFDGNNDNWITAYYTTTNSKDSVMQYLYANYVNVVCYYFNDTAQGYINVATLLDGNTMSRKGYYIERKNPTIYGNVSVMKGRIGINTTTPSYPLDVQSNESGISAYFKANVSAAAYITRTETYDKTKGSALSQIKDASAYLTAGKTDDSKFGYSFTQYDKTVIDHYDTTTKTEPVCTEPPPEDSVCTTTIELIDEVETEVMHCTEPKPKPPICENLTTTITTPVFKTIKENGVDLVKEIALIKQALYEANTRIECLKAANTTLQKGLC